MDYNAIELTEETVEIYKEYLENASYDDDAWATCKGRMVTIVNPDENSNYRYYLRMINGRYLSRAKTVDEAIAFLMTGDYIDCYDGIAKHA